MIAIEKLSATHIDVVEPIEMTDEQAIYAGTVGDFLSDDAAPIDRYVITDGGKVIGFFKIDREYANHHGFCEAKSLGLRAFLIDLSQQGKGIGKRAAKAIKPSMEQVYPGYHALYLTVNCKNPAAYRCYLGAGFVDTGELYLGGPAGPQHVMKLALGTKL